MSAQLQAHAAEMFAVDCGTHALTIAHDQGLYRHLRFRRPDTGLYWFDLITWPGHLAFVGDMGSYVFARIDDMLGFFLSGRGINPSYWAEKLQGDPGGPGSVLGYSEHLFRAHVTDAFREHADRHGWVLTDIADLWARIEDDVLAWGYDENSARDALRDFTWKPEDSFDDELLPDPFSFGLDAAWDWQLRDYSYRFLYCCHAIRWGAEQYRAFRTTHARRTA